MHLTNDGVKRQYFLIKQAENAFLDKTCVELKHSFFLLYVIPQNKQKSALLTAL